MVASNWIFNYLIISAPNESGGLYACFDGQVLPMDDRPTCGIDWSSERGVFMRGIQQGDILSITTTEGTREYKGAWYDIHDVLLGETEDIYLVSTYHNAIIRWSRSEEAEIDRWISADQIDSWHVNCLGKVHGKVCFSAFGDFHSTRGYKNATKGRGFLAEVDQNPPQIISGGLSQPHSILGTSDGYWLCNSEMGDVRYAGRDGVMDPEIVLDGYTRGLAIRDGVLFVGLSASRNSFEGDPVRQAKIVAIDLATKQEISRLSLPFNEVYGIIAVPKQDLFLKLVAQILTGERLRLLRQRDSLLGKLAAHLSQSPRPEERGL